MTWDLDNALLNLEKSRHYLRLAWSHLKGAGRDDLANKLNDHFSELTEITTEVEKAAEG